MMNIIDPHLHLFDLNKGQYHWLKAENPPFWPDKPLISKNFNEQDLKLASPLSLAGFVHIEAGFDNQQPWREIAWLEQKCQSNFRSVASLDITLMPEIFSQQLDKLLAYKSVVGIRHILDDEALSILEHENSLINLQLLAIKQLSFELQLSLSDSQVIEQLIEIISATSGLFYCINHAGWPPLSVEHSTTQWQVNLQRLSEFSNIYIKCSGFEMADRNYSKSWQQKVISQCIASFGLSRVMLASNFPLCLWQASYQDNWLNHCELKQDDDEQLTSNDINQLCYQNAHNFYRF